MVGKIGKMSYEDSEGSIRISSYFHSCAFHSGSCWTTTCNQISEKKQLNPTNTLIVDENGCLISLKMIELNYIFTLLSNFFKTIKTERARESQTSPLESGFPTVAWQASLQFFGFCNKLINMNVSLHYTTIN